MDEKYIELLINKCIDTKNKSLFISYNKEVSTFVEKLKKSLLKKGINDIYEEIENPQELHDILQNIDISDIEKHPYFNKSIWDIYAKKNASFVMIDTEVPGLMDDIEPDKISKMALVKQSTKPLYKELQSKCKLSWTIVAYPGKKWAQDLYKESNSYDLLKEDIYKMCMLDKENPTLAWNNHLIKIDKIAKYLNNLNIKKLNYKNSLGTNLDVYLPNNYLYASALDNGVIVNMPSYEIFTSPIYNKTEGIVYASKPLIYNGGLIEDFYLKFTKGKVVDFDAKKGKDILKGIINNDKTSCYLGECALVEIDSPIARMNKNYKTTLIDENASCHLALGAAFPECIKDGLNMSTEELFKRGINDSKTHVDFMIGTPDLNITATLQDNTEVPIFNNGKFSKEILKNTID